MRLRIFFEIALSTLLFISCRQVYSQISSGGTPMSFSLKTEMINLHSIVLQSPDFMQINQEDLQNDSLFIPRRFSILLPVNRHF